jgi:hypothetical protein
VKKHRVKLAPNWAGLQQFLSHTVKFPIMNNILSDPILPCASQAHYLISRKPILTENYSFMAWGRDVHMECSKKFKCNLYFYVSRQSRPFWAALILLQNSNMKFKKANTHTIQCMEQGKVKRKNPWFKPWFNILWHPQSIVDVTVKGQCLEYLGYVTLAWGYAMAQFCKLFWSPNWIVHFAFK